MQRTSPLFFLGLGAFCSCGQPAELPTEQSQEPIRNGVVANDYPSACLVDIYEDAAFKTRKSLCSGALIAPAVVLTAGHCVAEGRGFQVECPFLGQGSRGSGEVIPTYRSGPNGALDPDSDDIGVVYLRTRIIAPSYPPLRRLAAPAGSKAVNVGRILNGVASMTTLYRGASVTLQDGHAVKFPRDYATEDLIQPGDSGGPAYLTSSGELVAVSSGVNPQSHYAVLARVDLNYAWIVSRVATWGGFSVPPSYQPIEPRIDPFPR